MKNKLHSSLDNLCIERCPKCGHWTPMLMGSRALGNFWRWGGKDRYCMLCDTVFKEGLIEVKEDEDDSHDN